MTREQETIIYPEELLTLSAMKKWDTRERVSLVNRLENGLLISIHQNYYPGTAPAGLQVLYGTHEPSESLAVFLQEWTRTNLCPENRRVAAPAQKDIYLINHINCPGILVECGFLSHPSESRLLDTDTYRLKLAATVAVGIHNFQGEALL